MNYKYKKLVDSPESHIHSESISTSPASSCRIKSVLKFALIAVLLLFCVNLILSRYYILLSGPRRYLQSIRYQLRESLGLQEKQFLAKEGDPGDWQTLSSENDDENIFIYSAYKDKDKNGNAILRIISITQSYSTQQLYCYLENEEDTIAGIVPAKIETTKTFIDVKFSPAFLICPLPNGLENIISVSISPLYSPVLPYIRINVPVIKTPEENQHEFGVCVQPIFNYDKVEAFIQWMEYNLLMGVTSFTFYNISIGDNVSCYMKAYEAEGNKWGQFRIVVLPWSIPIKDDNLLHNNGQYGQANECLFRNRGYVDYLLMIDFDEYIIPNPEKAESFHELISLTQVSLLNNHVGKEVVQFAFANGIFDKNCVENTSSSNETKKDELFINRHVFRVRDLEYHTMKFITIPDKVIEPGIHNLALPVNDNGVEMIVDPEMGYLHHYKSLDTDDCYSKDVKVDRTGKYYSDKLARAVKKAKNRYYIKCH